MTKTSGRDSYAFADRRLIAFTLAMCLYFSAINLDACVCAAPSFPIEGYSVINTLVMHHD
jgi:hypothetical protein